MRRVAGLARAGILHRFAAFRRHLSGDKAPLATVRLLKSLLDPAACETPLSHKPRLVLAEDEPSLCQFLSELLASEYAVETAMNGEQAWEAILEERPDVVLSNVDMPVLSGPALVQRMRELPATAAVPVLLLSAQLGVGAQPGLAAGVDRWMPKPFRLTELLAALRSLRGTDD